MGTCRSNPRKTASKASIASFANVDLIQISLHNLIRILGINEKLATQGGDVIFAVRDILVSLDRIVLGSDDDRYFQRLPKIFGNIWKVFSVIVKLDQRVEGLKPGMTAEVELVLARLVDVLSVPVAAVFTEQEKTYCWRLDGGPSGSTGDLGSERPDARHGD